MEQNLYNKYDRGAAKGSDSETNGRSSHEYFYAPRSGSIRRPTCRANARPRRLRCAPDRQVAGGRACLRLRDHGPGVAPGPLSHLTVAISTAPTGTAAAAPAVAALDLEWGGAPRQTPAGSRLPRHARGAAIGLHGSASRTPPLVTGCGPCGGCSAPMPTPVCRWLRRTSAWQTASAGQ